MATRVVIRAERIDLPVISRDQRVKDQGPDLYPPCDVALYHTAFGQPGQGDDDLPVRPRPRGDVPAAARPPQRQRDGASLLGALVQVYTSRRAVHVYQITR